jgi:hypothetical protein
MSDCDLGLNAGQFRVKPKKFRAPLQMVCAGHLAQGGGVWPLFLVACIHLQLQERSGNLKRGIIVNHDSLDGLYLFFKVTGIDSLLDFIGKCFCP